MSQTKKQTIPAIRHHQVTEKRSYQYNKLYSTIDLQYAITLHFEILRVFLDIPPLSIVGPSGTQSTSSSLPPNTLYSVILALAYLGNFLLNIVPLYLNPSRFEFLYLAVFVLVLFFFLFDASPLSL